MYGPHLCNEYIKGVDAFIDFVKKDMRARMIALYIVDRMKTSRNTLFVDSIDSIVEKMAVIMRTTIETEEKIGLKRCFGTFLSFLI
jgi:TATA-binding protein-associated factor Taf7